MSKKMLVILMCVILVAVVGGILAIDMLHYTSSPGDIIVVGSSEIVLPEGYEIDKSSDHGTVIKKNDTKMSLYYADSSTEDGIKDYLSKHKGDKVTNSTEHYGGVTVYKYTLLDNKTKEAKMTHLFFDKNDRPYHFSIKGDYDKSTVEKVIIAL